MKKCVLEIHRSLKVYVQSYVGNLDKFLKIWFSDIFFMPLSYLLSQIGLHVDKLNMLLENAYNLVK